MKAVVCDGTGGPDSLSVAEVPAPADPGPEEILVRVRAAGVNRADILQRDGGYPPPPGSSEILGLEVCGTVLEAGKASGFSPGDLVYGLLAGGGYAELAVMDAGLAQRVPDRIDPVQAAAIPETFLTAWQCLVWIAGLQAGERVLIHGGAGGVGTAAIAVATRLGAEVYATAGTEQKRRACEALGAHRALDYRDVDFSEALLEATGGSGVDVILDCVGASHWSANIRSLSTDGRLVLIATLGGAKVADFDLRSLLARRVQITGTTLRSRDIGYKRRLAADLSGFLGREIPRGLRPVVDSVFAMDAVAEAHRRMEANENIGKIVLVTEQ